MKKFILFLFLGVAFAALSSCSSTIDIRGAVSGIFAGKTLVGLTSLVSGGAASYSPQLWDDFK